MLRKLGLSAILTALILVACGRQVTPDRSTSGGTGALPGRMIIKFRTANAMDFKNVLYTIVFNTSGNGQEPYANGYNTGYSNYSFIMVVDGTSGAVVAYVKQVLIASGQVTTTTLNNYAPSQLLLTPNSNGQGTEFKIDFDRTILYGIQSPAPATTAPGQYSWNINFITTDSKGIPLNTLGPGGLNDTSFQLSLNVVQGAFDQTVAVPTGAPTSGVVAANISGGEFINTP